jgi:hypothetical protein
MPPPARGKTPSREEVGGMLSTKDLQQYRQTIEAALAGLGRDDVGVGEVAEIGDGILSVTFSRGPHTFVANVPVDKLRDREEAERAVRSAIIALSKRVAHTSLQKP